MERYSGIIPDYDSFLEYIERPLPVAARVNTVKAEVDEAVEAVENSGYEVERLGWFDRGFRVEGDPDDVKLGNTLPHYLGWIQVQEEVSMVPPVALGADDGDVVLDTCAAPGGKTTHIADNVGEDGFVVANDDNIGRIAAMRNNTDRLGLTNVGVTNYDARRFPNQEFDAVLVDAPCSSEGTVRKLPQYLDGASEDEIEAVTGVQKGILSRATELVADGGTVVYST
ncbi:MAG: RsmB/NOP family class I SAM-dependent RNA methyltransferase, partial [Halobacteria archaeon]|nr:RsmB/NOP family class I SAM-dependent RNA methyltransferase [Halobacteria archaeon]